MFNTEQALQQALILLGSLSQDQVQVVLEERRRSQEKFGDICIQLGFVDADIIAQTLSKITGIPYIDLNTLFIDWEVVNTLDLALQQKYQALIFAKKSNDFWIAMVDPEDLMAKDIFRQKLSKSIGEEIHLQAFYTSPTQLKEIYAIAETQTSSSQLAEWHHSNFSDGKEVAKSVNEILQKAISLNVSDIHFQPEPNIVKIRHRIDGLLQTAYNVHKSLWKNFSVRIKILANLDIAESRRPQSGHFELAFGAEKCDFRVSTHPTVDGENIVIRILYKNKKLMSLKQLGFTDAAASTLLKMIQEPQGLFLICGPTGSGKTTTLYTLCSNMDAQTRNIMTLEEPIEYKLPNIRQTEIQPNGIIGFADGVRSILRQDPDVIFIGEIRDEDTAQIALRSAMTGHLVLATLHANDAFRAPSRLFDLGIRPSLLSGQILLIMSQRLVRRTCSVCKGKGCPACHKTGLKGRLVVSEIIPISNELDRCISEQKPIPDFMKCAQDQGFKTMYEDGLQKEKQGLFSHEELQRVLGRQI